MDISQFRAEMNRDGARPNLFRVTVSLPQALLNLSEGGAFGTKLVMTARASQIPGSSIGKVSVPYMGREIFLAGNRTFGDWSVTIMNDEDYLIRRVLERWMSAINSHRTNVRREDLGGSFDYVSDCLVEHLGKTPDTIIATYVMENVWPVDLTPIDLDFGTNDVIEEFTATFSFDDWRDLADEVA